ncbi:hypothetical protein OG422_19670 [Streptomyces sp. NBC_01525]|uniref:hypothetical protein n=1 Tax=Streptomyces sp. NBC_01525 TaxID=2903893 RepID=UPI003870462B
MAEKAHRRLRSGTVILGGMGVLAATLTACGSEPDKRCVDRNSYDAARGYRIVDAKYCGTSSDTSSHGTGNRRTGKQSVKGRWYYGPGKSGSYADGGSFSKGGSVSRGGFGHSGSSGG